MSPLLEYFNNVFERFTESARRIVFFARYEASSLGSGFIEPAHLLLALFREDRVLRSRLSSGTMEAIRQQIELAMPRMVPGIRTSVDLPVSEDTKRALAFAAEEADMLNHKFIDSCHLGLGLLRLEGCAAADLIRQAGITLETLRNWSRGKAPEDSLVPGIPPAESFEDATPSAASLAKLIGSLRTLVYGAEELLNAHSERFGLELLKRNPWSRKEALGHLIDYAVVHHSCVARALTEPKVAASGYPDDSWVSAQQYNSYPWLELVNSWLNLNHLMLHVWHLIPEGRIQIPCRIGVEDAVPLSSLLAKYVEHCDDIIGQILARL